MKRKFLIVAAIVVTLAGCQKEPCSKCSGLQENVSSLIVDIQGIPLSVTKGETHNGDERGISQIDIAIYDDAGVLEWAKHCAVAPASRQSATGLKAGKKTVCAVANLPVESVPRTIEEFRSLSSALRDNGQSGFVMTGSAAGEASPKPEPVTLKLSRLAAKVSFEGMVTTDWTEKAPASFDITDVYLANVSAESTLSFVSGEPSVNLRSGVNLTDDDVVRTLTVAEKESWEPGDPFNGGVPFYCYPNATDVRTCVMIKALYNGRVCYYPLVIDREIRNNTLYRIGNVTITCEGVENPWDDFTQVKTSFEITISDWDYNEYPEIDF